MPVFLAPDGEAPARDPSCDGPYFADGRAVWGLCQVYAWSDSDSKTTAQLVRFDLEAGVAELRWPLPDSALRIEALARHPSGRLAAVLSGGDVIVAKPSGGVTVVGGAALSGPVAGLAWRGDDLEFVPGGAGGDDILVLSGGRWTSRAAPRLASPPGMHARLQLAEHGADGLVLTYVRTFLIPGQRAELITRREDGSETMEVLPLPYESSFRIDRSAANAVDSRPDKGLPSIERVGGKWQFLAAPAGGSTRSDYIVQDGRLEWIPHDYYGRARIAGRWLDARDRHLLPIAGSTDLWAIDDSGAFVRLDRNLDPVETTGATALERWIAFACLLLFPLALIATLAVRGRRDHIPRATAARPRRRLGAFPGRALARVRRVNQRSRGLVLVLLAAMLSVGGAYGLYAGRERPADHRSVVFRAAGGGAPDRAPTCESPVVADGRAVWRICRTHESPPRWHLVRFDLERGVAEMRWPLPHERGALAGMARHPSGRLAAVMSEGDVLVVEPGGGASMIGSVPAFGDIAGLAWLGDDIEVVTGGSGSNVIQRFSAGKWTSRPAPEIEPAPDQSIALEMAERGPAGLIFTFVRTTTGQELFLNFITRTEGGAESVQKLQLDWGASGMSALDRSPANIISGAWYDHVSIERTSGKWQHIRPPSGRGVTADYFFDHNALVSIPRQPDGPARLAGRWLDATEHVLPIAGTTDVWALDDAGNYTRLDGNMRPIETMQATAFERTLAIAGLLVFPLAVIAVRRARSRSRAG